MDGCVFCTPRGLAVPNQTGSLQWKLRVSGAGMAGHDSGIRSGWQQIKQKLSTTCSDGITAKSWMQCPRQQIRGATPACCFNFAAFAALLRSYAEHCHTHVLHLQQFTLTTAHTHIRMRTHI